MGKSERSELEKAAGKLISAIQKEWEVEMGEPMAEESKNIMHACHDLLQASKQGSITSVLKNKTLPEFIGEGWLKTHPSVIPHVRFLELAENEAKIA